MNLKKIVRRVVALSACATMSTSFCASNVSAAVVDTEHQNNYDNFAETLLSYIKISSVKHMEDKQPSFTKSLSVMITKEHSLDAQKMKEKPMRETMTE